MVIGMSPLFIYVVSLSINSRAANSVEISGYHSNQAYINAEI